MVGFAFSAQKTCIAILKRAENWNSSFENQVRNCMSEEWIRYTGQTGLILINCSITADRKISNVLHEEVNELLDQNERLKSF